MADTNSTTTERPPVTPIEFIERRIAEMKRERPVSVAGRRALVIAIAELERISLALKRQAMGELRSAIREAGPDAHLGAVIENSVHGGER